MLFFRKKLTLFEAIATLVGTVIGAGALGIPYAVNKVGYIPGMIILVALTLVMVLRHFMVGEVALRTNGEHQIIGYYEIYLGKAAKYILTISFVMALYGSMLAYTIGSGNVLASFFGGDAIYYSLGFAVVVSYFIYSGLALIKRSEFILTIALFFVVILIALLASTHFDVAHLGSRDWSQIPVPYGVILFALSGATAIPEIRRELKSDEVLMKKALLWGTLIPAIVYFVFTTLTLGVSGSETTEIATVGLGSALGLPMRILGNLFALFAMGTSMLTLGLALRDTFLFDYNIKELWAWLLTVVPPILLVFVAATGFVRILNWVGGVPGGLASIAIIVMFWRARKIGKRTPEYSMGRMWVTGSLFVGMFIVGMWVTFVR